MLQGNKGAFYAYRYHKNTNRKPHVEVEQAGQRGPMTTGSGRNGHDLEKFTLSLSRKRQKIELCLLLNKNRKSQDAYYLP